MSKEKDEFLKSWISEKQSAHLYCRMAEVEKDRHKADLFQQLAAEAEAQAKEWERKIPEQELPPLYKPAFRVRLISGLLKIFGVQALHTALAAMKIRGLSVYDKDRLSHILPEKVEEVGSRHRMVSHGGNLRAAVFGINDGLISNASLIFGIVGATVDSTFVLLSGVAGLLAGAFSMAAGEYISIRSQTEMLKAQIALEKKELDAYPEEEASELALIYRAKGLEAEDANKFATALIQNPAKALDTLVREELGINPSQLGSPYGAALSSFLCFGLGAFIPLLPFFLLRTSDAFPLMVVLTALSLFGVGALMSLFTGRNFVWSGLRMLLIGSAAALITFWIGRLVGVEIL